MRNLRRRPAVRHCHCQAPPAPYKKSYGTFAAMQQTWDSSARSPASALARLIAGNLRFREARATPSARVWDEQVADVPQNPFAIVLGCSDSRTPVEVLFDQGFGDLFVVRIAGNIVAPSVLGSIEFAASQFGTRLVVVMGHTRCGAVSASVRALQTGTGHESRNIRSITDRIGPPIESRVRLGGDLDQIVGDAVRANVRASAEHLRHSSRMLEELVVDGQLVVVGAEYELKTGIVHFFDGVPVLRK